MIKGTIYLKNGDSIPLTDLPKYVSFSQIRFVPEHRTVCQLAIHIMSFPLNKLEEMVMCNYLHVKSRKLKFITALLVYSKRVKINRVVSNFINEEYKELFEYQIKFEITETNPRLFSKKDIVIRALAKMAVNWVYIIVGNIMRFLSPKPIKNSVIRAWTFRSLRLFNDHLNESVIYIYPYSLSIKRAIISIKRFRDYPHIFKGIPYSIFDLMKLLAMPDFYHYIKFEFNGYNKHKHAFEKFSRVYTSDDFNFAACVMHKYLTEHKVLVINSAHGIGCYSPYVYYSMFYTFNKNQSSYYSEYNSSITFVEKFINSKQEKKHISYFKNIVIVDQGDLGQKGFLAEALLQKEFYETCNNISAISDVNVVFKKHPLAKNDYLIHIKRSYPNLIHASQLGDWANSKTLLLSLYSTAYYDFTKYGKTAFIVNNCFNPFNLFGMDVLHYDISEFKQYLSDLKLTNS